MYKFGNMFKRLIHYMKPYRFSLLISILSTLIYVSATLYAPYIVGQEIVNLFVKGFKIEYLTEPLVKLTIVVLIGVFFGLLTGKLLNVITFKIIKDIRIDAFNKILNVPINFIDSHPHGDILTRVTYDVDKVFDGLVHGFTHIFRGLIAVILTIGFMFAIKWDIALIVVLLTPLSLLASILIAKLSHKSFKENAKIVGEMTNFTNENINNQRTVIAYDLNDKNNIIFDGINKKLYKTGFKSQFSSAFTRPTTRVVNAIIYASVALYGTLLIVTDRSSMNVGMLVVFLFYASHYTHPFNEISDVASELSSSFASFSRILELIDVEEIRETPNEINTSELKGEFKIQNVDFAYDGIKKVLNNITLSVEENKRIAIVGKTGCGKTTLINLLMRFYDPNTGTILFNNKNIINLNRNSLRDNVGMVLQDTYLFRGTVKENIRYSKLDATDEEIVNAAKLSNAHEFITKLKNGYDTIIDDDEGLSMGEKQLICITRLMLKLPKVLLLDEATSNIDTRTEVIIQKAFNSLMKGRTSIVIAHRLSTIRNSDMIIVMKDGRIVEQGNHQELLNKSGYYSELYNSL